jgi:hypothetical protein
VMVPYVCGNVAVLAERAERDEQVAGVSMAAPSGVAPRVMSIPGIATGEATPRRGGPKIQSSGNGAGGGSITPFNEVPEPGTLASIIAGLAAMAVVGRVVRRGGRDRRNCR